MHTNEALKIKHEWRKCVIKTLKSDRDDSFSRDAFIFAIAAAALCFAIAAYARTL